MAVALRLKLRNLRVDVDNLTQPGGAVYKAVQRGGQAAVAAVQAETPVRSGALRDAWDYRIRTTPQGVVLAEIFVQGPQGRVGPGETAAPSQYVRFVVFGTNGPIRSTRSKGVLKIMDGRGPVFHDEVAGQAANPFPQRALRRIRKQDFEE